MTIILSDVQQDMVYTMCVHLFPEFKYIRVSKYGIVKFKENWYSLNAIPVSVTDLCFNELRNRVNNYSRRMLSSSHKIWDDLQNIIADLKITQTTDLINILYSYYLKSVYIQRLSTFGENLLPEDITPIEEILGIKPVTVKYTDFQFNSASQICRLMSIQSKYIFLLEREKKRQHVPFYVKKLLSKYFGKKYLVQ